MKFENPYNLLFTHGTTLKDRSQISRVYSLY